MMCTMDTNSECRDINLVEMLQLQLTEIEMLNSMYPDKDEFRIDDPLILADINGFIEEKTKCLPNRLDYTLHLSLANIKDKLEVSISLPHEYPAIEPDVYARSLSLNREQQQLLNSAISDFLSRHSKGELYICSLITWLSDNAIKYFTEQSSHDALNIDNKNRNTDCFCRMWIYSHHIFNKAKRRTIQEYGKDLNLTGFCLPGKPGFICCEGSASDCSSFFQNLKQLSWKKLTLIKEEKLNTNALNIEKLRNFEDFQEISFQARKGPGREYHMDMGGFYKYLEAHNCGFAFQDFFGMEGRVSSDS